MRNNVFAFGTENQLKRTRVEPHISFTFTNNIVYFDQGRLLGSNWTGSKFAMDSNVYFDTRGSDIRFAGMSFGEWQASGQDRHSVIADPLFENAGNFDFRLKKGSPALKLGFKPIDMRTVGPRVPAGK